MKVTDPPFVDDENLSIFNVDIDLLFITNMEWIDSFGKLNTFVQLVVI